MKVKPIGKRLLVRKCYNPGILKPDGSVLLYLDDTTTESTNFATILDVSDRCDKFSKSDIGGIVLCHELGGDTVRVGKEDFVISEEDVLPAVYEQEKANARKSN